MAGDPAPTSTDRDGRLMLCNTPGPRRCGAERTKTRGGGSLRHARRHRSGSAMLHQWEEPVLSGTNGAGCVFFSGCNLGCVFCQNGKISHENFGRSFPPRTAAGDFLRAHRAGRTLHRPGFAHALHALGAGGFEDPLPVPVVWNSGAASAWKHSKRWRAGCRSICLTSGTRWKGPRGS